jgi:hypothetical protein
MPYGISIQHRTLVLKRLYDTYLQVEVLLCLEQRLVRSSRSTGTCLDHPSWQVAVVAPPSTCQAAPPGLTVAVRLWARGLKLPDVQRWCRWSERVVQELLCEVQAKHVPREVTSPVGLSPSASCLLSYLPHKDNAQSRGVETGVGQTGLRPQSCTAARPQVPATESHPLPTSRDQIRNLLVRGKDYDMRHLLCFVLTHVYRVIKKIRGRLS